MTIAEVKRLLQPGVEFTGEFVGANARFAKPEMLKTRRKVVSNKSQLVSEFLDGPKKGNKIYLQWAGLKAEEKLDGIYIRDDHQGEFLKIVIG